MGVCFKKLRFENIKKILFLKTYQFSNCRQGDAFFKMYDFNAKLGF
jgi:hypothetical protein